MKTITCILLVSLVYHQSSTSRPTSSTVNSNENDSSDSNSSSEESLVVPVNSFLPFPQLMCLNNRIVKFLQVGISFNDRLLQCTPSLTNLGTMASNRLADFNSQFDDLTASYAVFSYCASPTCRIRELVNLFLGFAQIAADLNAMEFALGINRPGATNTATPAPPATTVNNSTPLPISTESTNPIIPPTSTIPPNPGAPVAPGLNAIERQCVDEVVVNVTNVFNGISGCIRNFGMF